MNSSRQSINPATQSGLCSAQAVSRTANAFDSVSDPELASDPEMLQALTGLDASSSLAIAQRTRRAVREAAFQLREQDRRRRRNKGVALLVAMGILTLLTPALWSGVDELFAGEHLSDLPAMFTLLALTLFSAVLAALIASWKSHQPLRYGRRNF